MNIDDILLTV